MNSKRSSTYKTIAFSLLLTGFAFAENPLSLPDKVEFNRDVRPIFSGTCFNCHGPDKRKAKGRLQLHSFEAATSERQYTTKSGKERTRDPAIIPGDAESSLLWEMVDMEEMPPEDFHKHLSDRDRAIIKQWINEGAAYQGHWAYEPLKSETIPLEKRVEAIDHMVDERRKEVGIDYLAGQAPKKVLIRRLSLDLRGYVPSRKEVSAFLTDEKPDAWARLIDQFLGSEAYGERMATHWLDLVRYADSVGFHGDQSCHIYPYRDYVIKAFNQNMPFDQFTREQLAGDQLAHPTREQRIAASYNRLNKMTKEGGAQPAEYIAKYQGDRVRNVSAVWMGSTIGCAECHDHKYDPFTAKDYYRMAAFFADIKQVGVYNVDFDGRGIGNNSYFPPHMALTSPEQEAQIQEFNATLKELEAQGFVDNSPWQAWTPKKMSSEQGTQFVLTNGLVKAAGPQPATDTFSVEFTATSPFKVIRTTLVPDEKTGKLSRGNGNFVLTEVTCFRVAADGKRVRVKLASAHADYSQPGYPAQNALGLNKKASYGWAVGGHFKKGEERNLYVTLSKPETIHTNTTYLIKYAFNSQWANHIFSQFNVAASDVIPEGISTAHKQARLRDQIKAIKSKAVQVLETVTVKPRPVHILDRGSFLSPGEEVQPGVPHFMKQIEKEGRANRLDLARWLCSEDNPLAARAFANRIWQLFLGVGLSKNAEELGSQGEYPTNPRLLEFLATGFMDSGWNIKQLIKEVVMTESYRRDARGIAALREKDPYNRYYTRQALIRLDAEIIRDNALKISGLLVPEIGGPSVRPYQPTGYYEPLNFPKRVYKATQGDGQYRRGLYMHWQRTFLHPFLKNFDAPSREAAACVRVKSNTPLQALNLLNDPSLVEAARALAERLLLETGEGDEARLAWLMKEALGRAMSEEEKKLLTDFLQEQRAIYVADAGAANAFMSVGQHKAAAAASPVELASWAQVCRTVFNLHEFLVRR